MRLWKPSRDRRRSESKNPTASRFPGEPWSSNVADIRSTGEGWGTRRRRELGPGRTTRVAASGGRRKALLLAVLFACWVPALWSHRPAASEPTGAAPIRFENRQASSGIDFVLRNHGTPDQHMIERVLGGVALLDFDNDGLLDIYFTNGAPIPSLQKDSETFYNRLYRNHGDGTFSDVSRATGIAQHIGKGMSAAVA
ncbi:VCBS repeat-containing protein, partial [Acidobacteria bacterium AH-259-O06]|nr:VCBS repeat-containing protein [Acidobacteria bacterium AH-259-O06]